MSYQKVRNWNKDSLKKFMEINGLNNNANVEAIKFGSLFKKMSLKNHREYLVGRGSKRNVGRKRK